MKPKRIWTKDYGENGKEWIELQDNKYYIWKAEEKGTYCSFPICFETCREKFKEQGREFIPQEGVEDAYVTCKRFLDKGEYCTVFI